MRVPTTAHQPLPRGGEGYAFAATRQSRQIRTYTVPVMTLLWTTEIQRGPLESAGGTAMGDDEVNEPWEYMKQRV